MKRFLYSFFLLISLTSCGSTTYFYSLLNSDSENILKDRDGYFITERDSIEISYSFTGENAPIAISIYNGGSKPAYIDWDQSAIIINGIKNKYSDVITPVDSDTEDKLLMTDNSMASKSNPPSSNKVSCIDPLSTMNYQALSFSNFDYENIHNTEYKKEKIENKNGKLTDVRIIDFSRSTSPLKFRSYINIYKEPESRLVSNHEFYVSNLIKTKNIGPSTMNPSIIYKGDTFYSKKVNENQFAEIASISVLGSLTIVGLVAFDRIIGTPDDEE